MNRIPALCLALCLALARNLSVRADPAPPPLGHNAVLWSQQAPEHAACLQSLWTLAALRLDQALADPAWAAIPGGQEAPFAHKPPALILDLDETVLDNSPFVARLAMQRRGYDQQAEAEWARWVESAAAPALPGVLDFLRLARAKGVDLFFISNRTADQEPATRRNLSALGIEAGREPDALLLKDERPEWSADKTSRRLVVCRTHRVLLLLGDSLEDFPDPAAAVLQEASGTESPTSRWGREWILLPNPMYGGWEDLSVRPWDGR